MKIRPSAVALAGVLLAATLFGIRNRNHASDPESGEWLPVTEGPFRLWTELEGELAARTVAPVYSRIHGPATLVFIIPEGAPVRKGDVVARFDAFQIEQELNRLDREVAVAETDRRMLEQAIIPLELADLDAAVFDARAAWQSEAAFLEDSVELREDGLVSAQEMEQHRMKVEGLRARAEQLEARRALTQEHLHPARIQEAAAKLEAALRQRESMREQRAFAVLKAPAEGEAVYVPLALGGERRTVRIGDTLFRNQEFLCIPDPSEWIARGNVPEQDLSRVRPGMPAQILPRAFPGLVLTGAVDRVSAMGHLDSRSPGRRVFPATLRVESVPPEMKSGLTVLIRMLSRDTPRAVLVPRRAVRWEEGKPFCRVRTGTGRSELRELKLGAGNEQAFEVLSGLSPGDWVEP